MRLHSAFLILALVAQSFSATISLYETQNCADEEGKGVTCENAEPEGCCAEETDSDTLGYTLFDSAKLSGATADSTMTSNSVQEGDPCQVFLARTNNDVCYNNDDGEIISGAFWTGGPDARAARRVQFANAYFWEANGTRYILDKANPRAKEYKKLTSARQMAYMIRYADRTYPIPDYKQPVLGSVDEL